jgi:hypothetical protein
MVQILFDSDENVAMIYDNTSEVVFGRVFHDSDSGDFCVDIAEEFLKQLGEDPRRIEINELIEKQDEFVQTRIANKESAKAEYQGTDMEQYAKSLLGM